MKYELAIDLEVSRDRVLALFDDPENLKKWMEGLEEFETFAGETGQVGARSRFRLRSGKREVEIIETVTARNLPEEFTGTYETKGMWSSVQNLFEECGPNRTRWITHNEFRGEGWLKLIVWLMPGAFKKQSMKHMKDFKRFAESRN